MRRAAVLVLAAAASLVWADAEEEAEARELTHTESGQPFPDGMYVRVTQEPSDCVYRAAEGDTVSILHKGYISGGPQDGAQMDSNIGDDPLPVKIGKRNVLKGMEIAMEGMCEGETREVTIPPHLAFDEPGKFKKKPVPSGTTVRYEIYAQSIKQRSVGEKVQKTLENVVIASLVFLFGALMYYLQSWHKNAGKSKQQRGRKPGDKKKK
eukprot:TRINITY_DN18764_c0_g1_i1.p2 TRINITY_DN18764_c0_g1~~TRINITY_DN18764_c0_g1_i1.p2  ORF type:complete len:236 (+),score=85.73 TRINITY_DN18764_c0_g1_i1:84-710(+)